MNARQVVSKMLGSFVGCLDRGLELDIAKFKLSNLKPSSRQRIGEFVDFASSMSVILPENSRYIQKYKKWKCRTRSMLCHQTEVVA
jgi:hypothetical protein